MTYDRIYAPHTNPLFVAPTSSPAEKSLGRRLLKEEISERALEQGF
jgi:hypothetical protein